jgi:hypothetical protein
MAAGAFGCGVSSSWHTLLVLGFLPLPFVPAAEAPSAGAIDERSRCRRPLEDVVAAGGACRLRWRPVESGGRRRCHRGGETAGGAVTDSQGRGGEAAGGTQCRATRPRPNSRGLHRTGRKSGAAHSRRGRVTASRVR